MNRTKLNDNKTYKLVNNQKVVQPQEYIIWRSTRYESLRKRFAIAIMGIGIFVAILAAAGKSLAGVLGAVIILVLPGALIYKYLYYFNDYIVTNQRAMLKRFNRVVKEVPLNTPNLVVGIAGEETYASYSPLTGRTRVHSHVDIAFVANGIELLRFKKVDTGKANELFTKLRSMGFNVT